MKSLRGLFFSYFFFTIVIVFGVLALILYYSSTQFLENSLISDHANILKNITRNVSSQFRGRLRSLDFLASDLKGFSIAPKNIEKIRNYLKYETLVSSVHIYDTNGELIIAEKKEEVPSYNVGKTIYENDPNFAGLAKRVIETNTSILGPIFLTKHKNIYQTYVVPLRDTNDNVIGVMSGAVFPFLTDLKYTIEGLSLGEDNVFVVVSGTGHIVTQSQEMGDDVKAYLDEFVKKPDSNLKVEKAFPYFVLLQKDIVTDTHFLLFVSKARLNQKKEQMSHSAIIAYILSLLLGLLVSTLISRRLSKPIFKVHQVLSRLNQGDFTSRTKIKGNDVLSLICEECDELARSIEKDKFIGRLWSGKSKDL